jgi:hypothetical protein
MRQRKGEILLSGLLIGLALWAAAYGGVVAPALAQMTDTPAPPVRVTSNPPTIGFQTPMVAVTGLRLQINLDTATVTPTTTGTIWVVVTRGAVFQITARPNNNNKLATMIHMPVDRLFVTPTITPKPLILTFVPPKVTPHLLKLPLLSTLVGLPRLHILEIPTPTITPPPH